MYIIIKGAGDLASGIALRLKHAGFSIVMTELAQPLAVRRAVCFSQAVYEGSARVEDISAVLVQNEQQMAQAFERNEVAVFIDPDASILRTLRDSASPPLVLIDAIMAKQNTGTAIDDAPVVIGIGPGFTAGIDCHAVIETIRGHTLGRAIYTGSAAPNTGFPGEVGAYTTERLLRCGANGIFTGLCDISSTVKKGDVVALIRCTPEHSAAAANPEHSTAAVRPGQRSADVPIQAGIDGIVRGLLPSGIHVTQGMKAGDIDPRCDKSNCFTVSDKALSVGGGGLEALLRFMPQNRG